MSYTYLDDDIGSTIFADPSAWFGDLFPMTTGESLLTPPAPRLAAARLPYTCPYPLLQDVTLPPCTPITPRFSAYNANTDTPSTIDPSLLQKPSSAIISPTAFVLDSGTRLKAAIETCSDTSNTWTKRESGTDSDRPPSKREIFSPTDESSEDSSDDESDDDLPPTPCPRSRFLPLAPPAEISASSGPLKIGTPDQPSKSLVERSVTPLIISGQAAAVIKSLSPRAKAGKRNLPKKKTSSARSPSHAKSRPALRHSIIGKPKILITTLQSSIGTLMKQSPPIPVKEDLKSEPTSEIGWSIAVSRPRRSTSNRVAPYPSYTSSPSPPVNDSAVTCEANKSYTPPDCSATPPSPSSDGSLDAYEAPTDLEEVEIKPVIEEKKVKIVRMAKGKGRNEDRRKPQNVTSASTYRRKKKAIDDGYVDFFIELHLLTRDRPRSGLSQTIWRLVENRFAAIRVADGPKGSFLRHLQEAIQEKIDKRQHRPLTPDQESGKQA